MNRRRVLQVLGASALSLAGCLAEDDDSGRPGEESTRPPTTTGRPTASRTDPPTTATDTETATETTDTDTETPDEEPVESEPRQCTGELSLPPAPVPTTDFSDRSDPCPESESETTQQYCLGDIDDSTPLSFERSDERGSLPEATFSFTLHNRSERTFMSNFYNWRVLKYTDRGWVRVAPGMVPQPLHALPAGERHQWELTVDNTDDQRVDSYRTSQESTNVVEGLGGGHYAFVVDGHFRADYEDAHAFVARFRLDGPPLEIGSTGDLDSVTCADGVVEATATRDVADEPATYTLRRLTGDAPEEPRPLLAEQLLTERSLRDAIVLSRAYGADRVRLDDQSNSIPAVSDGPEFVRFEGETYRFDGALDDPPF